ncbi:MAG: hypothetical protein ACYCPW_04240 [Nitrososphaerales archaeon]
MIRISKEIFQLAIIVTIGVAIRLVVIPAVSGSPYGVVDVYYADKQAAKSVLDFVNPYSQTYIVNGIQSVNFVYLPFVPIYYAPFYILGDIRFGNIFADILIMLSVYYVAKSIRRDRAIYAPLLFAILPVSIWLTIVSGTNIMVGTAFLALGAAAVLHGKFWSGSLFLGIAVATNQLLVLALPMIIYYYWKRGRLYEFSIVALVAAAIILPFFIMSPSRFIYNVLEYQFVRPLQANGSYSLYSILYVAFGVRFTSWVRVGSVLVLTTLNVLWVSRRIDTFVLSIGMMLLLGAFILPVNGFWNYFLPSLAFFCALLPRLIYELNSRIPRADKIVGKN